MSRKPKTSHTQPFRLPDTTSLKIGANIAAESKTRAVAQQQPADHRGGPLAPYLVPRYESETGRAASEDFPELHPAHRTLLDADIPTIENVGGDVDLLLGKRVTIQSFPWRWPEGDACPVRLVALRDARGDYRIETGEAK